jgi:hypothetical protein
VETLARFEETALSIWLRESGPAFFGSLTVHSLAMAFVVGINFAIGLRVIGVAPGISLQAMTRFYPFHWYCAVIIFCSGVALLFAYPAKALTNPVFYFKLAALICALLISRYFHRRFSLESPEPLIDRKLKLLGSLSLLLWIFTITAGRFLAYTHSVLLASRFY